TTALGRGATPRRRTRSYATGPRRSRDDRGRGRDVRGRDLDETRDGRRSEGAHRGRPGGSRPLGCRARLPQFHGAAGARRAAVRRLDVQASANGEGAGGSAGSLPVESSGPGRGAEPPQGGLIGERGDLLTRP